MAEGPQTETNGSAEDQPAAPGVWRFARAERATVIIDAEDYFAAMQQAMLKATSTLP